jgi:hypothetical protein
MRRGFVVLAALVAVPPAALAQKPVTQTEAHTEAVMISVK